MSARESAIDALVDAATDLFAERGPDGVALRQVAARAGVNYGLIHQYIGTREDLLQLVIARAAAAAARRFAAADDPLDGIDVLLGKPGDDRYARLLVWAILQGRDPADLVGPSPALPQLIDHLPDDEIDPRVRAATIAALGLGWRLFERYLVEAAGLTDVSEHDRRAAVRQLAGELARAQHEAV